MGAAVTAPRALEALEPVSARSILLSLMLGSPGREFTSGELVAFARQVGVGESAARAALSRLAASGDVVRGPSRPQRYRLSQRLNERGHRQARAIEAHTEPYTGNWRLLVVTKTGRDPNSRAALRNFLSESHYAHLREGVWLRPDNLSHRPLPPGTMALISQAPPVAADKLWPLADWATRAGLLLRHAGSHDASQRFTAMAHVVRHLLADPTLPDELLPAQWPSRALRATYRSYRDELAATQPSTSSGTTPGPRPTPTSARELQESPR